MIISATNTTGIPIARAGLPRLGAHRLRQSLATTILRAGAPLPEVGQVLRHRSQLSTAVYAKVDHSSLRMLAQPWRRRCAMTTVRQHADEYLAMRRRLGFKLTSFGEKLMSFVGYLENRRHRPHHRGSARLGDRHSSQH
ncbi:tyrosine-type recombinase/integrase [Streptomyces sp. NPDC048527]|uniref:tyrosine-type recombinase/integrase n=1 Tax=Streptomyces sp. NPDC048527 TaxID=3365568 RepID=UPI00372169DB